MTEYQPDQRDHRTDVLLRFMNQMKDPEVLGEKSVEAAFSSEQTTRETLHHLDKEAFMNLLQGINGILRGRRSHDWKLDWERVDLVGFVDVVLFPPVEKKALLLDELYATMERMVDNGRELEDIATLVSSTLVAIHPFGDGNGRTSRLIHEMITHGTQEGWRERLKALLSEEGRLIHDTAPPNRTDLALRELLMSRSGAFDGTHNEPVVGLWTDTPSAEWTFPDKTSEDNKRLFIDAFRYDDRYALTAVLDHLQTKGTLSAFVRAFPQRQVIDLGTLLPELTAQEIESILSTYAELKTNYVRLLMDSIEHPQKEEYLEIERQSH